MKRIAVALIGLTLAGSAQAGTVTRIAAAPARDGWFVCDAVSGPYAAFAGAVTDGRSTITLLDRRTGKFDTQSYDVGRGDPGAGNIYWSLSQGGREVGQVHGINPGMVAGSDGIAPIKDLRIGATALRCRWMGNMAIIGLDSRRGVVVTEEAGGLVYRSFDHKGRGPAIEGDEGVTTNHPTLRIAGGTRTGDGFRFENKGFVYRIATRGGAATVTVTKAGRTVGVDRLVGFTALSGAAATD